MAKQILIRLVLFFDQVASNFNKENDPWEFGLDIDDSDLHLTLVLRSSSSTRVEPSPLTPNQFRIVSGPAGIIQLSSSTRIEPSSSTPNPVRIIPSPAGTIPETIHHKVIGDGGYGKDITVGAAIILANVSVFTHKPSKYYLNITMRNVVKVFRKDTIPHKLKGETKYPLSGFGIFLSVMGESEWVEVNRNKRRSVFDRLNYTRGKASNLDDLAKVSLSVYFSNFPMHLTMRELWNIFGQAYAFCRYIKVESAEIIIDALCRIRIGKLWLANVAMFSRNVASKVAHNDARAFYTIPKVNNSSYANVTRGLTQSCASDNVAQEVPIALTIDQTSPSDFPLALLGCYKDFRAIPNAFLMCRNEGFSNVSFKYLGGLWVLFEFSSSDARDKFLMHEAINEWFSILKPWCDDFVLDERLVWLEIEGVPLRAWEHTVFFKICNKWGEIIFSDDSDNCNRLSKRVCIKSACHSLIFSALLVTFNKVTYSIRIRELCSWTPTFVGEDSDVDDVKIDHEGKDVGTDDESTSISGSQSSNEFFENDDENIGDPVLEDEVPQINKVKPIANDSDPFGLNELIEKTSSKPKEVVRSPTPEHPPGFTPEQSIIEGLNNHPSDPHILPVRQAWGNSNFDFAASSSRGLSGGIICVWNNLLFHNVSILCFDNYVVVEGRWIPNDVQILWINVYAPQEFSCKVSLWSSLANLISQWKGCVMIMGDFNEVREANERYGSSFNPRHADAFNSFIDTSLLNVVLEKGLPNHRPILLKLFEVDYGPTPFRFFHSWLEMDGFKDLVADSWKNDGVMKANESAKIKKEHQDTLSTIDHLIDQGIVSEDDLSRRRDAIRVLNDVDTLDSIGIAQKARAGWDCGIDKSPGPDGFTFGFYRHFWKHIEKDAVDAVKYFFKHGALPK
nr:hypothetical protein [Tanacetum cinerariifolium]